MAYAELLVQAKLSTLHGYVPSARFFFLFPVCGGSIYLWCESDAHSDLPTVGPVCKNDPILGRF